MNNAVDHPGDELVFEDENAPVEYTGETTTSEAWRILIVDDDADVHTATTFALSGIDMQHRRLHFLHAYSAAEACSMLDADPDIAVILLDVVMEREDAGLDLVRHVRETLGRKDLRIILRTGQPGYAPEMDAIRDYDINDYKTKSELTRIKLYTTVASAIRSYAQIRALNDGLRGLDTILHANAELIRERGIDGFASGVLTHIASLLKLDSDSLVCRPSGDGHAGAMSVIAGTRRFSAAAGMMLSEGADAAILQSLRRALSEGRNVYGDDYAALYLPAASSSGLAAWIHTSAALSDMDRRLLEVFCNSAAVGLDNVSLVHRLRDFAFYDPLTRLPNRARLVQLVDELLCVPGRGDATLALVDIDHFAETNDALGHHFGDSLLISVAGRLQSNLGASLQVARVGSDTFAVLGHEANVNPAMILAQFEKPFDIEQQEVQLSATVGLVRLPEYDGDGSDALKDADIALKRAKLKQRASHTYFSRSMGVDIRERVRLMHALRAAVEARELFLVYQPQIDLASRNVVGAEALLRWKTADGAFIPPDRFIPIAEYSGIIVELGEWVMREACNELHRLRELGFDHFTMSVNVSQVQFKHPHFLDTLRAVLHDTGVPPEFVELEITESVAMEEPDVLIKLMEQVKQSGVSIAIDDFGTGFSSLSYLQQLKVDKLKIDRSFVNEITTSSRGSSIAELVIELGRSLDLAVIAEGVEDERQAAILTSLGCPFAQGYLFAKPLTTDALIEWLSARHPGTR